MTIKKSLKKNGIYYIMECDNLAEGEITSPTLTRRQHGRQVVNDSFRTSKFNIVEVKHETFDEPSGFFGGRAG